jgi:hypothetical protein
MFIDPANPTYVKNFPIAITTYEELKFTYKLTINPTDHTAKVTANYVIGRMTNLWLIQWLLVIPIVTYYNSTGTYLVDGTKISDETIYQFLEQQHIKMSIVLFQNSLVLNDVTKSTFNNQNVTDADVDVSDGAISTAASNEKIFEANFGVKEGYNLYNYTADRTEKQFSTHNAITRTAPRLGFAKNPLFSMHVALLKYVPLIVKHIDPLLYEVAKDRILDMTYSDYFYLISYPKYSGFKVQHDPTYTAYFATSSPATAMPNLFGIIVIGAIVAVAIIAVVVVLTKRASQMQAMQPATPTTTTT